MSQHAVVHFEIGGPDREALVGFYTRAFGWTHEHFEPADYSMILKMDGGIGGGIMKTPDGSPMVSFYVSCGDDVAGMLAKANELGGSTIMDVMSVPDGPTIAMFADPEGHPVGLVEGGPDEAPQMTGAGAAVGWFELGCGDATALQNFYRELFGWEINADNAMKYGETRAVGNGIGGGIAPAMGRDPYTTVYVAVEDLRATLDAIGEHGGKTVTEPMQVPGGPEIAHFSDPAGNFVGLMHRAAPPAS
jgi:uncharacterized protein